VKVLIGKLNLSAMCPTMLSEIKNETPTVKSETIGVTGERKTRTNTIIINIIVITSVFLTPSSEAFTKS